MLNHVITFHLLAQYAIQCISNVLHTSPLLIILYVVMHVYGGTLVKC
jgi:cyanate lyase